MIFIPHNAKMASADSLLTTSELEDLRALWPSMDKAERAAAFQQLPRDVADDFFLSLDARDQCELLLTVPEGERRIWMRLLAPDDAADLVQLASESQRQYLLDLLDAKFCSTWT